MMAEETEKKSLPAFVEVGHDFLEGTTDFLESTPEGTKEKRKEKPKPPAEEVLY
jgi:hypothetical protein